MQVLIEDSAPGVSDEYLPRLKEHLFRVEKSSSRASGGSGLGLAICDLIVNSHGGSLILGHSPLGRISAKVSMPLSVED